MKARTLFQNQIGHGTDWLPGHVVAGNVRGAEGILFHKGDVLTADNLPRLRDIPAAEWPIHIIQSEGGDVYEDVAALRLAYGACGAVNPTLAHIAAPPAVRLHGPVESRVDLVSTTRGLLKVDATRLAALNCIEGIALFSLYTDQTIDAGTVVAGAKVTPLLYPERLLTDAERICGDGGPIIAVKPFLPRPVGAIIRQRVAQKQRQKFAEVAALKFGWFGAPLLPIETVSEEPQAIAAAMHHLANAGAEIILTVGGTSSDPLDPTFAALDLAGARMERFGAPTHPGTNVWLAYLPYHNRDIALFGLASCGMFSRTTVGDLFLARTLAGDHLTRADIAQFGLGGLFSRAMAFRFPPFAVAAEE